MSAQPTIYARLMEFRLDAPRRELYEFVEKRVRALTGDLAEELVEQLRKAYQAGVSDGFQQGVAAESDCPGCKGSRVVVHAGSMDTDEGYCELRTCPTCSDGRRLGRSDQPIATESVA